ncbi:hypothetical protein Peur_000063 [Populus x canadensis]
MFLQRLPFTLGFIGSMVGTLYVSMVWHSYVLSVLFSVIKGSCPCILCDFLLPWRICWAKIPVIFPCLIGDETFREVTLADVLIFSLYIFSFFLSSRFSWC